MAKVLEERDPKSHLLSLWSQDMEPTRMKMNKTKHSPLLVMLLQVISAQLLVICDNRDTCCAKPFFTSYVCTYRKSSAGFPAKDSVFLTCQSSNGDRSACGGGRNGGRCPKSASFKFSKNQYFKCATFCSRPTWNPFQQFLIVHAEPKLAQTLQGLQGPREEVKTNSHQPGNAWPYTPHHHMSNPYHIWLRCASKETTKMIKSLE